MLRKWNKLAIISITLSTTPFLLVLVHNFFYYLPRVEVLGLFIVTLIISTGVLSYKQIKRTGEKGKYLVFAAIISTSITIPYWCLFLGVWFFELIGLGE